MISWSPQINVLNTRITTHDMQNLSKISFSYKNYLSTYLCKFRIILLVSEENMNISVIFVLIVCFFKKLSESLKAIIISFIL